MLNIFPLIVEIHVEFTKSEIALKKLNSLCDVEFILGLPCIMPLLECVHMLIKFTQVRDVFVYNFVDIVEMAHQK
jgi:hypothetical protein